MRYQYRCLIHGDFIVQEQMDGQHKKYICPECGKESTRIWNTYVFYFPDCIWHKDGSKMDPSKLPPAPQDQNWGWHGFGESKLFGGGKEV